MSDYGHFTYQRVAEEGEPESIAVYGWDHYPPGSVLAGQPRKTLQGYFDTIEQALLIYPDAWESHPAMEPRASVPRTPPADWSPLDAGESWDEDG